MSIDSYINEVDVEEIYKTIIDLEGPKHPVDNWDELEHAADYIIEKLESYGIEVEVHEFYLEDFEKPFRNIIGHIGDRSKPAILIGSHYDTVRNTPGANDNLSAVAVSLEVARVLHKLDNPPTVQIAVFTLEEGHPTKRKWLDEARQNNGWLDEKYRFTNAKMYNFHRKLVRLLNKKRVDNKVPITQLYKAVIDEQQDNFSSEELDYTQTLHDVFVKLENLTGPKKLSSYVVGSAWYAEKVIEENIKIESVIVYDCLGWMSDQKGSQKPLPIPEDMYQFMTFYKMDMKSTVGNYIGILGEKNSKEMVDRFSQFCLDPTIDIPHFSIHLPFEFETIYHVMTDAIRSDHAPFWDAGIPGIFISDTANFRSPYYHTGEDISSRLDYNMLAKIAKATIRTVCK